MLYRGQYTSTFMCLLNAVTTMKESLKSNDCYNVLYVLDTCIYT